MLGTLLHELVHIAHYGYTDDEMQQRLKITRDPEHTANISKTLAEHCFKDAKA
jgi:hypothetical protein